MFTCIVIFGVFCCGETVEQTDIYFQQNLYQDKVIMEVIPETEEEEIILENEEVTSLEVIEEAYTPTIFKEVLVDEVVPVQDIFKIVNYQENVAKWCLNNDNTNAVTLWKRTDTKGNLLIALKSTETDCFVATFKYEGLATECYNEWTFCNGFFEEVTIQGIIDYSFTAYHEVGGGNPENVQAQIQVLINRQKSPDFPDSIRNVITQKSQYSCAKCVTNRVMKADNFLEEEDLEKCFRQTLLVLSKELIQEVPEDVVFAAKGIQGEIWRTIDKTIYCFK